METFSALLAICAGNSPVSGEFPAQRPVTRSFEVFFDLHLVKRLSKHSRGWWLRRYRAHHDVIVMVKDSVGYESVYSGYFFIEFCVLFCHLIADVTACIGI